MSPDFQHPPVLLDGDMINAGLQALSDECTRTGTQVELTIIGGAAMVIAYERDRLTQDVDAKMVTNDHTKALQAVRQVGLDLKYHANWLNEQAVSYMTEAGNSEASVQQRLPGLTIKIGSREYMLALKLSAGRPQDINDAYHLTEQLGISEDPDTMREIAARYLPPDRLEKVELSILEVGDLARENKIAAPSQKITFKEDDLKPSADSDQDLDKSEPASPTSAVTPSSKLDTAGTAEIKAPETPTPEAIKAPETPAPDEIKAPAPVDRDIGIDEPGL